MQRWRASLERLSRGRRPPLAGDDAAGRHEEKDAGDREL
jgi:hypothetical protein